MAVVQQHEKKVRSLMRALLNRRAILTCYFFCCCILLFLLAGVRSEPVYGKLDFMLLDARPWWPQWKPMILSVLQQGKQPVLADIITSTVLRGAFAVDTVSTRYDYRFADIRVEKLLAMNSELRKGVPVGAFLLLLEEQALLLRSSHEPEGSNGPSIKELMLDVATGMAEKTQNKKKKYRYRCLINLHDFTPSWVSEETGHWPREWAEPSLIYEFQGMRGKEMEQLLRDNPPENCMVFF